MHSEKRNPKGGARLVVLMLSSFLLLALLLAAPLFSQDSDSQGQMKFYPEVKHKRTIPLREMKSTPPPASSSDPDDDADARPRGTLVSKHTAARSTAVRSAALAPVNVTAGLNFEGVDADSTRATPDTNGAVGATQYLQWVNLQFEVFDKTTGALLYGPFYGNTLWTGFGGPCETSDDGDIVAEYDKIANVWVMSQHAYGSSGTAPFYLCVAVSNSSDASGTWNLYAFTLPSNFPDYPKLAVWPDAYYVSINEQNPVTFANLGGLICALDRQNMLAGAATNPAQCFEMSFAYQSLLPSDLDGSILPPAGSPNYVLDLGTNSLNLWQFHVDWQTPANTTFTGPVAIPVATFAKACGGSSLCVPQVGTSQLLDGIGDRLMFRLGYRHFADGHESLVASHTISSPSGVRWYEIRNPGGTPEVFQQGTFAPDSNWRWMPSIAMDQMGDIAVGYSVSSSSMAPAIRYTGRLQSDALNTMETENSIIEGSGSEQGSNRWGDYSSMSIDPVDDCTFFYTNQYQSETGSYNWNTRIASFKFPSCTSTPPVTLSPNGLYFTDYAVGATSPAQTVTLTNKQSVALNISAITPSGDFSQTNTCGSSVAAGGTCTLNVSFTPTAIGLRTGQIAISDDAASSPQQVITLTGTGGGPAVTLAQTTLTFSGLVKGTTTKSVKLTNSGSASLTLNTLVASGDYALGGTCITAGFLAPTASCTISVSFTPTVTGTILGVVSITDNAPGSPHLINLSGTGLSTLSVTPFSLALGTVAVGSTGAAQTVTITNNATTAQTFSYAGGGDFGVAPGTASPCGSSPASLNPATKCSLSITFAPTQTGAIKGALTVADTAAGLAYNPQIVSLSGTGTGGATLPLAFQPASEGFGNVVVGSSLGPKSITLKNSTTASITLTSLTASGDFSVTATGAHPCQSGTVLAHLATCTFSLTFTPSVEGSQNGSVTIVDNATTGPTTQVYNLTGTGVWPIVLSPVSLTFPAQAVGTTSAAKMVTLLNYSSSAVSLTIGSSANYSVVSGGTAPCGTTVAAASGQTPGSCTFEVTFTPANTGAIKGAVTITHNAAGNNSPQVVSLSGTGQ